jgi:OmpA-OmpF porin, OOP family
MRYCLFLLFFAGITVVRIPAHAQITLKKKISDVKNKVNTRVENKIDKTVNNGLNAVEESLTSKKEVEKNQSANDTGAPGSDKASQGISTAGDKVAAGPKGGDSLLNAYVSKFDFVPGEKIMGIDAFESEQIGDFPANWDTDASGEIVTFSGRAGKWLKLGKDGFFLPEFFPELPENFTLELDIMVNEEYSWFSSALGIAITTSENKPTWRPDKRQRTSSGILLNIHPVNAASTGGMALLKTFTDGNEVMNSEQEQLAISTAWRLKEKSTKVHLSIWKQGQRLRVYLNEKKYWDLPRAFTKDKIHNKLFLLTGSGKETEHFFVSNFRLAAGTPDTRNKLISEGAFTTNGITFDVNSDRLKEESYGILREIAAALKENPTVRVKIIGHTDSDGTPALNQELSLKRARSVQNALVTSFGIEKSRIEVEGKGSTESIVQNNSPLNKALNRRVQFVRL